MTDKRQAIEAIIRAYFWEMGGGKLDDDQDGWLFDGDSNWGFQPAVLADKLVKAFDPDHQHVYYAVLDDPSQPDGQRHARCIHCGYEPRGPQTA